jgi:hypothetical protein
MEKDLNFMRNPDLWPAWPFLPLVKRQSEPSEMRCGYMLCTSTSGANKDPSVYIGYIFDANPHSDEKKTYDTFEKVAEEWRVD